ncbi:MAG: flagellar hook-length control protein FliK [Betaproteobacteria bacterium]
MLFSICLDEAQVIGPELRPTAAGRLVTSGQGPAGAADGAANADPEMGESIDGPADFAAELAARLETRARERLLTGLTVPAPGDALDSTDPRAAEADGDAGSSVCRSSASEAGEPRDAGEAPEAGEARERGAARGKGRAQENPHGDAGLALHQELVKALPAAANDGPAQGQGHERGQGQAQEARAMEAATGVRPAPPAAVGPETAPGGSVAWSAESGRAEPLPRRVAGRPASVAMPLSGSERVPAARALQSGAEPAEELDAGEATSPLPQAHAEGAFPEGERGDAVSGAPLAPLEEVDAAVARETPSRLAPTDEPREASMAATQRARGDGSARGDGAGATCCALPDERGQAAVQAAPLAPTGGGARQAASPDRGKTVHRLTVRESPDTGKPATAGSAGAGESRHTTTDLRSAEVASDTIGSARDYQRSPEAGIRLEIVPSDDAPAWLAQPGRRGVSAPTSGPSGGLSGNVKAASEDGSTTRGAQRTAFSASREMPLATDGLAAESVSRPPRAEAALDGATPAALAEGKGVHVTPAGVVFAQAQAEPSNGGAGAETVDAKPCGVRDMIVQHVTAQHVTVRDAAVWRGARAEEAMVSAEWRDEATRGKADVGDGGHEEATSCEMPGESRTETKVVEVGQASDTRLRPPGETPAESPRYPQAPAGERSVLAIRKEHGKVPRTDAVPRQEPAAERGPAVPEAKTPNVEEPASGCFGASRQRGCDESTGAAPKRCTERENAEIALDKPSAAPLSSNSSAPHEAKETSGQAPHGAAAHERQAPITARAIIDQIVQRAQLRLARSEAEMVIDLKPDVLGKVHLKITAEQGRVVAEIRAESAATRQLIEAGLGDLKAALAEKGLDLGAVAVSSGFGTGVAWNGGGSRWPGDSAGHGLAEAAPRAGRSGALRGATSFATSRPSAGSVHLVDCVA